MNDSKPDFTGFQISCRRTKRNNKIALVIGVGGFVFFTGALVLLLLVGFHTIQRDTLVARLAGPAFLAGCAMVVAAAVLSIYPTVTRIKNK